MQEPTRSPQSAPRSPRRAGPPDVLCGLDYLSAAGLTPDARVSEAIDLVESKQDADGRWPLENPHESELVDARVRDLEFDMDEREGRPSRWNTLRALRVMHWSDSAPT